jgi:hypothetical protein
MFLLGIGLATTTDARASRFVPPSLTAPSTRMMGLDLSGAARMLAAHQAVNETRLGPPEVGRPPVRKLFFRNRNRPVTAAPSRTISRR